MQLLHIDSSISNVNSVSRQLSSEIVEKWRKAHADLQVQYLDLAIEAPNPLTRDALGFRIPVSDESLTAEQRAENEVSAALVEQVLQADVIVIGSPLYNFTIPAQLKSWLDRIAQGGKTFKYTENGPVGLLGDKTVILALSRGGIYSTSEAGRAMEHQESYLKAVFGFMGVTDVQVVRAEGLDMGAESREQGLAQARQEIEALAA
ncbi:FMN-dependent NADH-azoreductase [Pusillimonas sp. CC-YST705]|uniref:FMN dependent NADH:quinone oxidoreductase n=1 Tax=Mesopusillimonas faecipullorum TaxID=2755040 RepID=A0ABS8CBF9_9BURK|nr:FMN-dependent NADH-azoreductase [Mesopusillimonas faecipullorum]MCB5363367.1 FMN-dependent NADH-azoreductase [Mesopusillimonas faecipullorum]